MALVDIVVVYDSGAYKIPYTGPNWDLNPGPSDYLSNTLTTELLDPTGI